MPFDCPACGKQNKDDAKACEWCPESFPDEDDELRKPKFKRIDPGAWSIKRWVAIFMAIGFLIWRAFAYLAMTIERGAQVPMGRLIGHQANVEQIINADPNQNKLSAALGIILGTAPPVALAGARAMRESHMARQTSAAAELAQEGHWLFKGTVHDLVTLKPVGACALTFSAGGKRHQATSDFSGRYSVVVPELENGGYDVDIRRDGYARTYLNPGAENVAAMIEEDRADLARDLNGAKEAPYQVQAFNQQPLVTDFYIAPKALSSR